MPQVLTELIEGSLTTSLDQDTSAPVVKDEDCRQMVSTGRVLPFICTREDITQYTFKTKASVESVSFYLPASLLCTYQTVRLHLNTLQKLSYLMFLYPVFQHQSSLHSVPSMRHQRALGS